MMNTKMIWSIVLVLQLLLKVNSETVLDITKYGAQPDADISEVTS